VQRGHHRQVGAKAPRSVEGAPALAGGEARPKDWGGTTKWGRTAPSAQQIGCPALPPAKQGTRDFKASKARVEDLRVSDSKQRTAEMQGTLLRQGGCAGWGAREAGEGLPSRL
jgi:hypothetical protein